MLPLPAPGPKGSSCRESCLASSQLQQRQAGLQSMKKLNFNKNSGCWGQLMRQCSSTLPPVPSHSHWSRLTVTAVHNLEVFDGGVGDPAVEIEDVGLGLVVPHWGFVVQLDHVVHVPVLPSHQEAVVILERGKREGSRVGVTPPEPCHLLWLAWGMLCSSTQLEMGSIMEKNQTPSPTSQGHLEFQGELKASPCPKMGKIQGGAQQTQLPGSFSQSGP